MRDRLERGPGMDTKSGAGLGLAINWLQQALILTYANNCPFKPVKTGMKSVKWATELESLRRKVRRLLKSAVQVKKRMTGSSSERPSGTAGRR
jgi:hypothetical protein